MEAGHIHNNVRSKLRIIFSIVLAEYLLFVISGTSFTFLNGDPFFSLEADPLAWSFYLLRIPQFILGHLWIGILLDVCIILGLILFIRDPLNNKLAILLFILLLLFYVTFMGHLAHRNYQFGFFMVFIPFLFRKESNRAYAFESLRYFILFFYFSAGILKLMNHSLSDPGHLSHLISGQFTPYFLEGNTGMRTNLNLYLIEHTGIAYILYLCSFIIELAAIIGFFTKRFDKWLVILFLAFHMGSWLLMDIAPFGQVSMLCLLFFSRPLGLKRDHS